MLRSSDKLDIDKMKQYHRTKDMINLLMFFPDASPIKDLFIVESVEDYNNNYAEIKDLYGNRIDSFISRPVINNIETKGNHQDLVQLIKQIKEIDPQGVLVLFDLSTDISERYERYAGISVGVSVSNGVYIDAVGKGFDGREVSKGIATHERYFIPWTELIRCNKDTFKSFQTYLVDDINYKISRDERINYLLKSGVKIEDLNKNIPIEYEPIPLFIWEDLIKNILSKLLKNEDELLSFGFSEFAISGHTEGKKFTPWQMFDKGRYVVK